MTIALQLRSKTDEDIKVVLTACRGDLFHAAESLGCKALQLDQFIRKSDELQRFMGDIIQVRASDDYDKLSSEQFSAELENKSRAYRVEALDIIHELADMPYGDSAAMAEVKLKAAIQLRGKDADAPVSNEHASVLAELNQLYQQTAPRIKSVRALQIEFQE